MISKVNVDVIRLYFAKRPSVVSVTQDIVLFNNISIKRGSNHFIPVKPRANTECIFARAKYLRINKSSQVKERDRPLACVIQRLTQLIFAVVLLGGLPVSRLGLG